MRKEMTEKEIKEAVNTYNGNNFLTALDYLFFNSMIGKYDEKIYSKDCRNGL